MYSTIYTNDHLWLKSVASITTAAKQNLTRSPKKKQKQYLYTVQTSSDTMMKNDKYITIPRNNWLIGVLYARLYTIDLHLFILGMAQGYSCDFQSSAPLCPVAYVSCTCVVTGNTSTTQWRFSNVKLCLDNSISLSQQCLDTPSVQRCGQYLSAANADPPNGVLCTTSILNITAHATLDGMMVECWDMRSSTRVGTTDITIVTG